MFILAHGFLQRQLAAFDALQHGIGKPIEIHVDLDDDDDDDEDEHEHEHHHHDHDEDEHEHHHHDHDEDEHEHHHHDHDEDEHEHHHHDHDEEEYGLILRAKGILQTPEGDWFQFDYVPGELQLRDSTPDYAGRLVVIGTNIDEKALKALFNL